MTRNLVILAVLFLVALIGLFVVGFSSNTPALLIMSIMCAMPLFCLFLGAAIGRATNELTIMRKTAPTTSTTRVQRTNSRIGEIIN